MSELAMTSDLKPSAGCPGKADFLGLPLTTGMTLEGFERWLDEALARGNGGLFASVNPSAWAIAEREPSYVADLSRFDLVLPDGSGVVLGARLLGVDIPERLSFDATSLAGPVFRRCVADGLGVALVGAAPGVADEAATILREAFPGLQIRYVRDGYFDALAPVVQTLRERDIQVAVVGMGVPRQESVMLGMRDAGWRGLAFGCGGFLDQLRGGLDYYPAWVDRLNLRFLYRVFREPGRLWRRYAFDYQPFLRGVMRALPRGRGGMGNGAGHSNR